MELRQQQINKPAVVWQEHHGKNITGDVCGAVTHFTAIRRGTLQAVGNVMGSLYLSVLFLGKCLLSVLLHMHRH